MRHVREPFDSDASHIYYMCPVNNWNLELEKKIYISIYKKRPFHLSFDRSIMYIGYIWPIVSTKSSPPNVKTHVKCCK